MSAFFVVLKTLLFKSYLLKQGRFRLPKCYFGVLAVKYRKAVFQKLLTRFWIANSVKYENVVIGAIKRSMFDLEHRKGNTKVGKQGVRSLYSFETTK